MSSQRMLLSHLGKWENMFRAMVHLSLNINKALAFINMYFVKKNREQGSEHFHFYIVDIHTSVRFFFLMK